MEANFGIVWLQNIEDRDGINFSSVLTLQCTLYDLIDFKLSFSQGNSYQI